jgi:hypothetical protein
MEDVCPTVRALLKDRRLGFSHPSLIRRSQITYGRGAHKLQDKFLVLLALQFVLHTVHSTPIVD